MSSSATCEPDFPGDGVWPPKHDWVERVANYCLLRSLMHAPREYTDVPITSASVLVFFPAAAPECPRVIVRAVAQRPADAIEVEVRIR